MNFCVNLSDVYIVAAILIASFSWLGLMILLYRRKVRKVTWKG